MHAEGKCKDIHTSDARDASTVNCFLACICICVTSIHTLKFVKQAPMQAQGVCKKREILRLHQVTFTLVLTALTCVCICTCICISTDPDSIMDIQKTCEKNIKKPKLVQQNCKQISNSNKYLTPFYMRTPPPLDHKSFHTSTITSIHHEWEWKTFFH